MARYDVLVAVRYPRGNRRAIERAAERRGVTLSRFIREATMREAVRELTDRQERPERAVG